jgi:putative transcriptional regulator
MSNNTMILTDKIIIATPNIKGSEYNHTVIYIATDNEDGSIGFMLNQPIDPSRTPETNWTYNNTVYYGGPADNYYGVILHSSDYRQHDSVVLNPMLYYSSSTQILHHINYGGGPNNHGMFVGYSKWTPNTLKEQIIDGNWFVTDFDTSFFFKKNDRDDQWRQAMHRIAENITNSMFDKDK